jgi:hypothetical protein
VPRSIRACRTVGNARKGLSSVRWVTFAIVAAHISRADNVLRNDTQHLSPALALTLALTLTLAL